jgi:hypothetical protein
MLLDDNIHLLPAQSAFKMPPNTSCFMGENGTWCNFKPLPVALLSLNKRRGIAERFTTLHYHKFTVNFTLKTYTILTTGRCGGLVASTRNFDHIRISHSVYPGSGTWHIYFRHFEGSTEVVGGGLASCTSLRQSSRRSPLCLECAS